MILGAISSTDKKDFRSAIHPDTIKYLLDMGIEVIFESGAGDGISAVSYTHLTLPTNVQV